MTEIAPNHGDARYTIPPVQNRHVFPRPPAGIPSGDPLHSRAKWHALLTAPHRKGGASAGLYLAVMRDSMGKTVHIFEPNMVIRPLTEKRVISQGAWVYPLIYYLKTLNRTVIETGLHVRDHGDSVNHSNFTIRRHCPNDTGPFTKGETPINLFSTDATCYTSRVALYQGLPTVYIPTLAMNS